MQTETKRKQELQYSYKIKIDFQIKAVKRDKEGHYIMIKRSIQDEDITITNIYAPNIEHFLPYKNFLTKMQKAFEIC